jgi:predicted MPP superfamily phosphohydrolase
MAFKRPFALPDFLDSFFDPLQEIQSRRFRLRHPDIEASASGVSVTQLTDLHMGQWIKESHIGQIVDILNQQPADIYALTGDYVGYDEDDIFPCIEKLDRLDGPAFAVFGNHDHWTSGDLTRRAFSRSNIQALSNESVLFSLPGSSKNIRVVGVDDHATNHSDLEAAFSEVSGERFCLTLNHVPAVAPECAQRGADLILSGHTHGYQLDLPGVQKIAERMGVDFYAGPYRLGNSYLYICRGLGSTSWPFRIGTKPEIATIELTEGSSPRLELVGEETFSIDSGG